MAVANTVDTVDMVYNVWHGSIMTLSTMMVILTKRTILSKCELVVDDTVDSMDIFEGETGEVANRMYHISWNFSYFFSPSYNIKVCFWTLISKSWIPLSYCSASHIVSPPLLTPSLLCQASPSPSVPLVAKFPHLSRAWSCAGISGSNEVNLYGVHFNPPPCHVFAGVEGRWKVLV